MTAATLEASQLDVSGVSTAIIDTGSSGPGRTGPEAPPVLLLHGSAPGIEQMRKVIGLFAHDRGIVTDDLVQLRYQASLRPHVRDSWQAMFPPPRQRWVDDLALSGTELASVGVPALLVHGRDDRVVPGAPRPGSCSTCSPLEAARALRLRALDDDREDRRLPGRRPALPGGVATAPAQLSSCRSAEAPPAAGPR